MPDGPDQETVSHGDAPFCLGYTGWGYAAFADISHHGLRAKTLIFFAKSITLFVYMRFHDRLCRQRKIRIVAKCPVCCFALPAGLLIFEGARISFVSYRS